MGTYTRTTALVAALLAAWAGCNRAETPKPAGPAPAQSAATAPPLVDSARIHPGYEAGKGGNRSLLDYGLALRAITPGAPALGDFKGKPLLVFYFLSTCPHCQHAFPFVQKLADELKPAGIPAIAIATKSSTDSTIRTFIRDRKVALPVYQDSARAFSQAYGTGYVPLILVVNPKGEFIRYKQFDENVTPGYIKEDFGVAKAPPAAPASAAPAKAKAG